MVETDLKPRDGRGRGATELSELLDARQNKDTRRRESGDRAVTVGARRTEKGGGLFWRNADGERGG